MLPIRKIYIDSRFKSTDSVSDSNFKVDLPQSISFPDDTSFYIHDVSIPVSWYAIDENRNNWLFYDVDGVDYAVQIAPGSYSVASLNTVIVDKLNELHPGVFTAEPQLNTNQIGVKINGSTLKILTDTEAAAKYVTPLYSINDVLRNFTPATYDSNTPYRSGYIDLFPVRNLYISSPNLGNFNTMSVWGDNSIIKKVPVNAGYNQMVFDQVVLNDSYLDCSKQTFTRLEFQLKDSHGNIVDLKGNHWSFSIGFLKDRE